MQNLKFAFRQVLKNPGYTVSPASPIADRAIDPTRAVYDMQTHAPMRDANMAPDRLNTTLLSTAAPIALMLAVIGIYGAMAFWVAQRRREIGVRMALGARRRDVLNLVLSRSLKLVLIGIALGLIGAFGFSRGHSNFLFQVDPNDIQTLALVTLILIGIAVLPCAIPARRAAKLNPVDLLQR